MNKKHATRVPGPKKLFSRPTYYAQTLPGLEQVAWQEVKQRLPGARLLGYKTMSTKNGLLFFTYTDDPALLNELRTIEDVFYVLASLNRLPPGRPGLDLLPDMLLEQVDWSPPLGILHQAAGPASRASKRMSFRVISRVLDAPLFYRKEAQERIERAVHEMHPRWQLVEDDSDLELWLNIFGDEVVVGLRLSDRTMRHRDYKHKHLPASLRPTAAAAMVLLSEPQDGDVFLDPMCGAGTLLIERALWGRYRQLLGGDIRDEAVEVALANIGTKYKPIQVERWDATKLTQLKTASVDRVVCNLPFGRQVGSRAENETLYRQFLGEMVRVLKPGGRMVLLTGDFPLLQRELRKFDASCKTLNVIPFLLLGVKAEIFVVERQNAVSQALP